MPKSIGYALRNKWAKVQNYYLKNVDTFLCLTSFQKNKLINAGFSSEKLDILPNFYNTTINASIEDKKTFTYVAFSGRLTFEKGADILAIAANLLPDIIFKIAGNVDKNLTTIFPKNVYLMGHLNQQELAIFYQNASCLVLPSIWYEGFPMVLLDAMNYGLPVIASDIGGIPEIVEHNRTGLLFDPGNPQALATAIQQLASSPKLALQLAEAAFEKLKLQYSSEIYYKKLMEAYNRMIKEK